MPERAKKAVSEQIAERYENFFKPADDLVKDAQKPRGLGPEAYMNAAQKIERLIREEEKQGKRNPELYLKASEKIERYLSEMPLKPGYVAAKNALKDALTRWKYEAKRHR